MNEPMEYVSVHPVSDDELAQMFRETPSMKQYFTAEEIAEIEGLK